MRSLIAVLTGVFFIITVIILMQLAFLFLIVGYNELAKHYPYLNNISGSFRYLLGIPVVLATMFSGGYLTAYIARTKALLYSTVAGILALSGITISALKNANLTLTGAAISILALAATTTGGLYWQRKNNH